MPDAPQIQEQVSLRAVSPAVLPRATRALYWAVQVLAHLALPLVALLLLRRGRKEPGHLRHLSHRLGLGPTGAPGAVWIYAASLGETRAAAPLVRELVAAGRPVLLTHQSPAGLAEGERLFGDTPLVTRRYVPSDLFWAVRLFLRRARPAALVVLEIELWPAMLIETARAGIPAVMANGNLLDETLARNRGLRRHVLALYALFARIYTRTEAYRARYLSLGLPPGRVEVVGELKSDQRIEPAQVAAGLALRARWPVGRVLMIASSVEGEEADLLSMLEGLMPALPDLGVIWAPRSPQRFDAVAAALADRWPTARRSALGPALEAPLPSGCRVIVGDSTGDMNVWYPMADLVFVGASLVPHGGHNILEPMAHGRGVVMGPSTFGIDFAAVPAARAGAFESHPDAAALGRRLAVLLADPARLAQMGQAAADLSAGLGGAARRTAAGIQALLAPKDRAS